MLFPDRYVAILQPYSQTECLWASKDAPQTIHLDFDRSTDTRAVSEKVHEEDLASL